MACSVAWDSNLEENQVQCTCAPCKSFWKKAFKMNSQLKEMRPEDAGFVALRKGDRVLVRGSQPGVVRYIGYADDHLISPELNVGVCLYDYNFQKRNGIYNGKRYFFTPKGHAAMVKYSEVTKVNCPPKTRPLSNPMFSGFENVKQKRKERLEKIRKREEALQKQHEKQKRANGKTTKSAPPPSIKPRPTRTSQLRLETDEQKPLRSMHDENDMALKDYNKRIEKSRNAKKETDPLSNEEREFQRLKKSFGGDERAQRMAETYKKLLKGYEQGRIQMNQTQD